MGLHCKAVCSFQPKQLKASSGWWLWGAAGNSRLVAVGTCLRLLPRPVHFWLTSELCFLSRVFWQ